MSSTRPLRVVVVGGGLSGLAAALRLREADVDTLLVSPDPLGGKARTAEPRPGWRIELGPHTFTGRATHVAAFATRLGLPPLKLPSGARYLSTGRGMQRVGPLWLLARPSLVLGLFRAAPPLDDESVADWFVRRFGAGIGAPLRAMMAGIWASPPERIEMRTAFPSLHAAGSVWRAMRSSGAGGTSGTFTVAGGLGAMAEAAATKVSWRQEEVRSVRPGHVETSGGGIDADAVIVCADAPTSRRLLGPIVPDVTYAPLAVAHWLVADTPMPRGFGCLSTDPGGAPALGTIFTGDLFPDRMPKGLRGFTTMLGGLCRPTDAMIDTQAVPDRLDVLHRTLTGQPLRLEGLEVVRHPAAVAVPEPGHAARIAAMRAALPPGLHVAGAWTGAAAMDDAVRSGEAAADAVLRAEARRAA